MRGRRERREEKQPPCFAGECTPCHLLFARARTLFLLLACYAGARSLTFRPLKGMPNGTTAMAGKMGPPSSHGVRSTLALALRVLDWIQFEHQWPDRLYCNPWHRLIHRYGSITLCPHERQPALRQAHASRLPPPGRSSTISLTYIRHHYPNAHSQESDKLAATMFRMKLIFLMAVALLATVVAQEVQLDAGKS